MGLHIGKHMRVMTIQKLGRTRQAGVAQQVGRGLLPLVEPSLQETGLLTIISHL